MKVIRLPRNLQYPMSRNGSEGDVYMMHEGWDYVCSDGMVRQIKEVESREFSVRDVPSNWEGQKDFAPGATLTILCPGGIGDLLCLRAVLAQMRQQYPGLLIHVIATPQDTYWLAPYIDKLSPYPVRLDAVESFEFIASLEDIHRQSPHAELYDAFADILHVDLPAETPQLEAPLILNQADRDLAKWQVRNGSGRPKIGIQVASATDYRSYPNHLNALLAMELTQEGHRRQSDQMFDVYFFGTIFQSIRWREDGELVDPPEHIHDICGRYQTNAEMIALVDEMDVLIVPDSAIMHIGAYLEKPTLAFFSITEATQRTGYYPTVAYIQGEADCAPCQNIAMYPSCGERFCKAMLAISPYYAADVATRMYEVGGVLEEGLEYDAERHGPLELADTSGLTRQ